MTSIGKSRAEVQCKRGLKPGLTQDCPVFTILGPTRDSDVKGPLQENTKNRYFCFLEMPTMCDAM